MKKINLFRNLEVSIKEVSGFKFQVSGVRHLF